MLGGIIMPKVPPAHSIPIENVRWYPAAISAGYMMEPTASSVTIDEPEMAAKIPQARRAATARPPGTGRMSARMRLINRSAMEPCDIIAPARIYSGTDSRTSRLEASHMS